MVLVPIVLTSFTCGVVAFVVWCYSASRSTEEIKQNIIDDIQAVMDIKMQTFVEEMMKIFIRINEHTMACVQHNPVHVSEHIQALTVSILGHMQFQDIRVIDCNEEHVPVRTNLTKKGNRYEFDMNTEMIIEFDRPVCFKQIDFIGLKVYTMVGAKVQLFASLPNRHSVGTVMLTDTRNSICNTAITYFLLQ